MGGTSGGCHHSPLLSEGGHAQSFLAAMLPQLYGASASCLLKQIARPAPRASPSVGLGSSLRIGIPTEFPGDAADAGPEPTRRTTAEEVG